MSQKHTPRIFKATWHGIPFTVKCFPEHDGLTERIQVMSEDHAPYIGSWLKVLKQDKRAIFTAASHAQKAADYLHGFQAGQDQQEEAA